MHYEPPIPVTGAEPAPTPIQRMLRALALSVEAFRPPVRRQDWLIPLLLLVVLQIASGVLLHDLFVKQAIEQQAELRSNIEENQSMSAEQKEETLQRIEGSTTGAVLWISTIAGPVVGILLLNLLLAAILLLFLNFGMGADAKLHALWFVAALSWSPKVIEAVLFALAARVSGSIHVAFGPAAFVPYDGGVVRKVLEVFDLFDIWRLLITIVGIGVVARVARPKAITAGLGVFILGWLVMIVFALLSKGIPGAG